MDLNKLKGYVPEEVLVNLKEISTNYSINSTLRMSHFLSQTMHESGGFKFLVENLNYSSDSLKRVFPKYFPGNLSESYARQPEKIGSRVYGGRMGNGDESTKEGYKFRGRGYIQLTGKDNYKAFSQAAGIDVVSNPDLVSTPKIGLASAAWFFKKAGLNEISDKGTSVDVITQITKKINGGTNGLDDRIKRFSEVFKKLTS